MSTIAQWFKNARPTALPQSMFPSLTAIVLAVKEPGFSFWLALCAIIGVFCAHLGINLFDDYFDYKKKRSDYREQLTHEGFRARISKCEYLTSGKATVKELLFAACSFCGVALLMGILIYIYRGLPILYIALVTGILGVCYSGPPLRLSYHGLGDLVIALIFGPLNMIGTYFASCGTFNNSLLFISIPIGLLVMNIVYVHSIMDYIPDKKIGKKTFAVLLNNKNAMLVVLFFIITIPFISIVYGIIIGYLSIFYLITLICLPMAISLFYLMVEFQRDPYKKFTPKFWMGPMGKWDRITQVGIDWFMIRWFSARNMLSFFCVTIIIASLL